MKSIGKITLGNDVYTYMHFWKHCGIQTTSWYWQMLVFDQNFTCYCAFKVTPFWSYLNTVC